MHTPPSYFKGLHGYTGSRSGLNCKVFVIAHNRAEPQLFGITGRHAHWIPMFRKRRPHCPSSCTVCRLGRQRFAWTRACTDGCHASVSPSRSYPLARYSENLLGQWGFYTANEGKVFFSAEDATEDAQSCQPFRLCYAVSWTLLAFITAVLWIGSAVSILCAQGHSLLTFKLQAFIESDSKDESLDWCWRQYRHRG